MSEEELLKTKIEVIKYLSDSYMLNVIVDIIDDTIELLQEHKQVEQESQKYKEVISAILNWNIFKNECPMNFGYDKNTIEDKAQEVFYENDDYCENNCNDDYKKCWLKYFRKMQELEKGDK